MRQIAFWPQPYISAVSKNVTPISWARLIVLMASLGCPVRKLGDAHCSIAEGALNG